MLRYGLRASSRTRRTTATRGVIVRNLASLLTRAPAILIDRSRELAGFAFLLALAAVLGGNVWLARSSFVPILGEGVVEYVFLSARASEWILASLVGLLALIGAHVACSRLMVGAPRTGFRLSEVAYFAPLSLFAFNFIALANLVPATRGWFHAWSYLAVDLRPWLAALIVGLFCVELDRRADRRLGLLVVRVGGRWLEKAGDLPLEIALVAVAAIFVWVSSPLIRSDFNPTGDEPKYLRYCENWYQGNGFDISTITPAASLPLDYSPPLLNNLRLLGQAACTDLRQARNDLRDLWQRGLPERFNRAKYMGNWFLSGKDGGVYQFHTPGLSFLLFPFFAVDRYLLNWRYDNPKFPLELRATMTGTLALYLLYVVVIFRFLRGYAERPVLAWSLALLSGLIVPLSAFPFQWYPELSAGIVLLVVSRYVLYGDKAAWSGALAAGLLAGYLPWMHVRFLVAAVLLLCGGLWSCRRRRSAAIGFAAGWALSLGSMSWYAYHVTGSLLPTALYDTRGEVLDLSFIGPGLFGFLFDGSFGVLAHAPVLLLAFAGIPGLVTRRPRVAGFCGLIVMATAATAAAHDFTAAQTTPGRFLVSILPFGMLGLVEAIETWRTHRWFRLTLAVLVLISLETAWVYNGHHYKVMGRLVDTSFSGWRLNLLFPDIHGRFWREAAFSSWPLYGWVGICVALTLVTVFRAGLTRAAARIPRGMPSSMALLALLVALGTIASGASVLAGRPFEPSYLRTPIEAKQASVRFAVERGCWFCTSSVLGRVRSKAIFRDSFSGVALAGPLLARAGEPIEFQIWPVGGEGSAPWGTVDLDFGDGTVTRGRLVFGPTVFAHQYASPGQFIANASFTTGPRRVTDWARVAVSPGGDSTWPTASLFASPDVDLPKGLMDTPPAWDLRRAALGYDSLCFDPGQRIDGGGARKTRVWLARWSSDGWHAREFHWREGNCVSLPATAPGQDMYGHVVAIILTRTVPTGMERSQVLVDFWPGRDSLLRGAPLVLRSRPQPGGFWSEVPLRPGVPSG